MSNKLLPVSALAVYRFVSSNSEVVVSAPRVTIRTSTGQLKSLYTNSQMSSMMDNPFTAPPNGQWTAWTKAEMDPIIITLEKGNASVSVPLFLTPSTEMVISENLPFPNAAQNYGGYTPDYIGQDYLYQVTDEMDSVTRRLFKSFGQTALDWIEIQLVVS